ncbi:MAG: hypothetical protein EBW58_13180, partial [Betaproteobacteria bacterium]|nr:hypothetical protein [Betaproteobacteria bacterium]
MAERSMKDEQPGSPNAQALQDTGASPWLIRVFAPEDRKALVALWTACGLTRPWNNPERDIDRKRANSPQWLFIAEVPRSATRWTLIGSVMVPSWNLAAVTSQIPRASSTASASGL